MRRVRAGGGVRAGAAQRTRRPACGSPRALAQVATLRGHPLYKVTSTEVLADSRNSRWKAEDHTCARVWRAGGLGCERAREVLGCAAQPWEDWPLPPPPVPPPTRTTHCCCRSYLSLLKAGTDPRRFGGSLYLGYGGDPTLSTQRWEAARRDTVREPWQRAEPACFWNRALAQPLLDAGMARFVPPAFMGFAKQVAGMQFKGAARTYDATITLIARRSGARARWGGCLPPLLLLGRARAACHEHGATPPHLQPSPTPSTRSAPHRLPPVAPRRRP